MVTSLQERIGDGIRVVEVLRESGAELLVEARDLERHVPVVLKVLDLELVSSADALQNFEREAARAVGFRHFNIATAQPLERRPNLVFYALNVGYARTLESLFSAASPPSFDESVDILRDVASALDYEHSHDSIHGRLAPEMIFVDDDHVMVSGFGSSLGPDSSSTVSPAVYQAPEQSAWRQEVDGRVDVFALGVIAFELISGKRCTASTAAAVASGEPLRIARDVPLRPGVSMHVNEAIMHAVAKRPSLRYATAGEFVFALDASQPEPVKELPESIPAEKIPRMRMPILRPRLATALGIGGLCLFGALTLFSFRKKIGAPHVSSTFVGVFSRLSSPLESFDKWMVHTRTRPAVTRTDSGIASPQSRRVTTSGVVVENGVLVFPGEKVRDSLASPRGSATRRSTPAVGEITKPTAH
jgi:serine/threonine protein kinase